MDGGTGSPNKDRYFVLDRHEGDAGARECAPQDLFRRLMGWWLLAGWLALLALLLDVDHVVVAHGAATMTAIARRTASANSAATASSIRVVMLPAGSRCGR